MIRHSIAHLLHALASRIDSDPRVTHVQDPSEGRKGIIVMPTSSGEVDIENLAPSGPPQVHAPSQPDYVYPDGRRSSVFYAY